MSEHHASCRCGQLHAVASGDPVRVSVCHCLNCKKRSGSVFAVQARWPADKVAIAGNAQTFRKVGDRGNWATFHFCPNCGSDVYFTNDGPTMPAAAAASIAIPLGAFDDPSAFTPTITVYEDRRQPWVQIVGTEIERYD